MKVKTYVMPEPKVKIDNSRFSFEGKAISVNVNDNVLDYLRAAGVYNSKADVYNGSVDFDYAFGDDFSIQERLGEVDEVLAIVDRKTLEKDLDEKGYAFWTAKENHGRFYDFRRKGFMTNMDRIVQDLSYQKLRDEQGWNFDVRHLKLQEGIELMSFDKDFKAIANNYWMHNLEIVQALIELPVSDHRVVDEELKTVTSDSEILTSVLESSVYSVWHSPEARPLAAARSPLNLANFGVATFKKVEPRKVA